MTKIGVRARVARERGEAIGQSVGYQIRLESKKSQETRMLFCTTGILLRRMGEDTGAAKEPCETEKSLNKEPYERALLTVDARWCMCRKRALLEGTSLKSPTEGPC